MEKDANLGVKENGYLKLGEMSSFFCIQKSLKDLSLKNPYLSHFKKFFKNHLKHQ